MKTKKGNGIMLKENLTKEVYEYIFTLSEDIFSTYYKENCTIMLSGSAGWMIEEGFDEQADWDIHILLSNDDYKKFCEEFGSTYKIVDSDHKPPVFCNIFSYNWLNERLKSVDVEKSILYLWLYTHGLFIQDSLNITNRIEESTKLFRNNINELVKKFYVLFSVRRLDACSSAKRGLDNAAFMYRGEMVKATLQTLCLLEGNSFPYNKWLWKFADIVVNKTDHAKEILNYCEKCLKATDIEELIEDSKILRDLMEQLVILQYGNQRWISHWWEYNEN